MTPDEQKFMAFEGLLGWTAAVVIQAQRVSTARDRFLADLRNRGTVRPTPEQRQEGILRDRLAQQFFQTERQLFCNAAKQLLRHRQWVKRLSFLDDALFDELDKFARDIEVMRDMNEHVVEYFEGKGLRPRDWEYISEEGNSDASGTVGTKIGGRLDWMEVGSAAQRLLKKISPMGPFFPQRTK